MTLSQFISCNTIYKGSHIFAENNNTEIKNAKTKISDRKIVKSYCET